MELTDILELVGLLLIIVAIAVALWAVHPAIALAAAGGAFVGLSYLLVRKGAKR